MTLHHLTTGPRKAIAAGMITALAIPCLLTGASARGKAVSSQANPYPVATSVRVGGNDEITRFVMDFSKKVGFGTFTLADPYRVVIDIPEATFRLPEGIGAHGRGLVKAFRYGLVMQGGSRIVIATSGPTKISKAFSLPAKNGQPARVVIELRPTDRQSYLRNVATSDHMLASAPKGESPTVDEHDSRPLIVLDPGHGGIDPGTHWKSIKEKNIVLAFGLTLRHQLRRTGKYRVLMTRTTDIYIPLEDRVRFARSHRATLFISMHCDSIPSNSDPTEGATIYTESKKASDAAAAREAGEENSSDEVAGINLRNQPNSVASILFDLAQRETKNYSLQFAHDLRGDFKGTVPMHDPALKSAAFVVLKDPDVPSVLVELGYLSSKQDRKNLTSPAWRKRAASAFVQAINAFFAPRLARADGAR